MIFRAGIRKNTQLIRDADAARDAKRYHKAALLYERALRLEPDNAAIHVQCGHMFKEAGDLIRAEHHYNQAKRLTPNDPDLALQFGHFYKVAGRLQETEVAYRRAIDLAPDWPEPAIQLADLYRAGWRAHTSGGAGQPNGLDGSAAPELARPQFVNADAGDSWCGIGVNELFIPELVPQPPDSKLHGHSEEIEVRWFGLIGRTPWGARNILRGVEAIRGFCISATPIIELRVTLNGLRFYSGKLQRFPLRYEKYDHNLRKYVFNIWYDFSHFREGLYDAQLQFFDESGGVRVYNLQVVIRAPLLEGQYPSSDRLVSVSATDNQSLEEHINSRPSMIRLAKRTLFATPPRNVLIQRVDQLGDMVVSVPALRRLRELLPEARLVGLLSLANAELAKTLDLFDEIVAVDFPDDEWERRRVMPLDKQYQLRRRLEPFKFDVAIDLSESEVSRPLLQLSGARFLMGFGDGRSVWLSATYEAYTSDAFNHMEEVSAATKILGLVEYFGTLLQSHAQIITRDDLERSRLAPYGLSTDRFAVLHTGARLKFSQWPYYDKLASMILENTDLKVVMMADDPATRRKLGGELIASDRFQLLDKRLPFDDFDALLSFCTVFVGNDSGPSHLASLRGANVVNLFLARHNWNEWGHESRGYIISRRVPCAGCNIHHDPDECGKGFACITNISQEEVFRTVMKFV
jgi:ADP-heptose:LPS heptosyltransferase